MEVDISESNKNIDSSGTERGRCAEGGISIPCRDQLDIMSMIDLTEKLLERLRDASWPRQGSYGVCR